MSVTATTLSSAVALNDTTILVAALTGLSAGNLIRIDNELMKCLAVPSAATVPVPVLRGQDGTAQVAHPITANVVFGTESPVAGPADFNQAAAGAPSIAKIPSGRTRRVLSYSAAGAITLPSVGEDMVAIINGTAALAMTLADPSKAQDGDILYIVSNGKAAHTVTDTAGLGANTTNSDVITFNGSQKGAVALIAANGNWQNLGLVAGAATVAGPGLG